MHKGEDALLWREKVEPLLQSLMQSLTYYRDCRYNVEREDFDHMIDRIRAVLAEGEHSDA